MKKYLFIVAAFAAAAFTTSCSSDVKPSLKSDVDSLAYDLGIAQADGLYHYMTEQLGVDSTQLSSFIKGMKEGALKEGNKSKDAFYAGTSVGKQVISIAKGLSSQVYGNDSTQTVNPRNVLAGLIAGLTKKAPKSAEVAYSDYQKNLQPIISKNIEKQYGEYKKSNEQFLKDNAKKAGIVALPNGLQYQIIEKGNGVMPNDSSTVVFHYVGTLIDGTEFDNSKDRKPLEVKLNQPGFIKGMTEILKIMPKGSKWKVFIPQDLGYGDKAPGSKIKPFSTLIFDIDVLDVK